jgi:WD40 repeat protein/tetratricopeptide (TPR) repeat protein
MPAAPRIRVPGYEVLGVLGRGGMGVVYKARQIGLNRAVALKMIRAGVHAGPEELNRFRTEAEAVARLQHANIVQIYDIGEQDGLPYFSLEYVEGSNLHQELGHTPQPPVEAARLVETLARAVHAAHQRGIIHRDLKPSNILLRRKSDPQISKTHTDSRDDQSAKSAKSVDWISAFEPKVSDFGLAKQIGGDSGQTHTGEIIGTPSYMAPEQATGKTHDIGPLSDVYGLGAILYEMLTGRPPFKGATTRDTLDQVCFQEAVPPGRLQPRLPRDLETICLKCLQKEPRKRYASAQELADDLGRYLAGEPIKARPVGAWGRGWRWARRRPAIASLSATSVLLFLLGFGLVTWQWWESVKARRAAETAGALADEKARDEEEARKQAEAAQAAEAKEKTKAIEAKNAEATERKKAVSAQRESEASAYTLRIALAQREWMANNVARAEAILDQCPPGLRGWEWHYLKRLCHSYLLTLPGGRDSYLAFSPDGSRIVTTGIQIAKEDGKPSHRSLIRVWEAQTGQELHAHVLPVEVGLGGVRFTPDGKQLIAVSSTREMVKGKLVTNSTVKLLDPVTGKETLSLRIGGDVGALAVSADGQQLTTASSDGTVRVWSLASRAELHSVRIQEPLRGTLFYAALAFSSDGKRVAAATAAGTVKVWDAATAKELAATAMRPREAIIVYSVVFSPDGDRLAMADNTGVVQVYDAHTGRPVLSLPGGAGGLIGSSVAFSPDGTRLAASWGEGVIKVWEVRTGLELLSLRGQANVLSEVRQVTFSPDGYRLAAVGDKVYVWDATTGQEHRAVPRNGGMVKALAFSPDGRAFASACEQALNEIGLVRINVCDTRTGQFLFIFQGHKHNPVAVSFFPDGRRLVSGDAEGMVNIWELGTGKVIRELATFPAVQITQRLRDLALSPDGKQLAAAGIVKYQAPVAAGVYNRRDAKVESQIKVWDLEADGAPVVLPLGGEVESVAFTPDGKRVMAVTWTGTFKTWELATSKEVRTLELGEGKIAISPDGTKLASAQSRSGGGNEKEQEPTQIKVWDIAKGRVVRTMHARYSDGITMRFSPDGKRLAYSGGARDRGVHIWDVDTGHETFSLFGTRFAVTAIAFSPDGRRVASGGMDPTVVIRGGEDLTPEAQARLRQVLVGAVPAWHYHDGENAMAVGQEFAALFHLDRAVAALPRIGIARARRGYVYAHFNRWNQAAKDYEQAIKLPIPVEIYHQYALVLLKKGDQQGYRQLCAQMLKKVAEAPATSATPPNVLNTVVWTCALAPDATRDPNQVVALTEKLGPLIEKNYALANTYGAVLYRAGKADEAIKQLNKAVALHREGGTPGDWLFLAMAHQRKGNAQEAKKELDKAKRWRQAVQIQKSAANPLMLRQLPWETLLEIDLLYQEAEQLLKSPAPDVEGKKGSTESSH